MPHGKHFIERFLCGYDIDIDIHHQRKCIFEKKIMCVSIKFVNFFFLVVVFCDYLFSEKVGESILVPQSLLFY